MTSIDTSRRVDRLSAAQALFACLASAADEFAGVAYLARDRRVLGLRLIRGGRDSVSVSARTLTIDALAFGADGVVVAHNHPSGDARPSVQDLDHARRVSRALGAVDIRLLDHLVIVVGGVTSLRALGVL
jgi:DNA repair protein RadC